MLFNYNISTEKYKPKNDDSKLDTISEQSEIFCKEFATMTKSDEICKKYSISATYNESGKYMSNVDEDERETIPSFISDIKKCLIGNKPISSYFIFMSLSSGSDGNIKNVPQDDHDEYVNTMMNIFNHMLDLSHKVISKNKLTSLTIETDGDKYEDFWMYLTAATKGKKKLK